MVGYTSPYEVLGLKGGETLAEVKDAYRRLCMQHHPDLCPPDQKLAAEKYFKEITEAYTRLSRQASSAHASTSSQAAHAHWARGAAAAAAHAKPGHYSNGVVGAVIAAPLFLLGMWLQHKSKYGQETGDIMRPHGILHPPQNPFLREDMKPRTQSRFWNSGWNAGRGKQLGSPPKKKEAESAATAAS
ncbi:hypothetical protein Ndes2526B_g02567 [Nannochloris sp. 'desiccata']|nr:putative Chaperone protein DnaJ [Chlorella desiccata (nom. nud.)]